MGIPLARCVRLPPRLRVFRHLLWAIVGAWQHVSLWGLAGHRGHPSGHPGGAIAQYPALFLSLYGVDPHSC